MSTQTVAKIKKVREDKGVRVYQLEFSPPMLEKSACVTLNFEGHDEERAFYSIKALDKAVNAVVHTCPDLRELGADVYYAWQPRISRKPSSCPRCKNRIDIVRRA